MIGDRSGTTVGEDLEADTKPTNREKFSRKILEGVQIISIGRVRPEASSASLHM